MASKGAFGVTDVVAADFIGDGAAFSCTLTRNGDPIARVEYRGDGGPYHFAWLDADGTYRSNGGMPDDVRTWADSHQHAATVGHPMYDENISFRVACLVDAALSQPTRQR